LFSGIEYTGIDISKPAIALCKKKSDCEFIAGDFIKMNLSRKYDFVFSHEVIDHVYDPDLFLVKILKATRKYAYISAYRGYFPELIKHKMEWDDYHGCNQNELSVNQIKNVLKDNGLTDDEFVVREQERGQKAVEVKGTTEIFGVLM